MTTIYQTKYLAFKSAKSPSGNDWFYVKRTNDSLSHDSAVVITTLVKKENGYNFLLLKTSRPPLYAENKAKFCIESPAGLIADEDKQENLNSCIKKELLEEAGYSADKIFIEMKNCSTSSGLSSETLTYVTAIVNYDKLNQTPVDDGGIIVERFFIQFDKIHEFLKQTKTESISIASATVCGIYFAIERFKQIETDC